MRNSSIQHYFDEIAIRFVQTTIQKNRAPVMCAKHHSKHLNY